jgi:hypothetical protein
VGVKQGRYGKLIAVFYGKLIAKIYGKILAVYISAFRSSDFLISGSAISSHKNIH